MQGIDLFKEYIIERERKFLHYDEERRGFVTYSFPEKNLDQCFIDDLFILDSKRDLKVLLGLLKFVESDARKHGKTKLIGAVSVLKPDCDRILKAHLWYGMKPFALNGEYIYTGREI